MSVDNATRRAIAHQINMAANATGSVGMPLGMWCGNGDYSTFSEASRDKAGRRALAELNDALTELANVRDQLAAALNPGAENPEGVEQ